MLRVNVIATYLLEIIRGVYRQMVPVARDNHHLFSMDVPLDMEYVMAEEGRVQQVLVNLLGNAFRNTPAGGSITLRARREGDQARISVIDTGKGIPEGDKDWLFDPYHRRTGDRDRLGGLGVGLPLSKYIVEKHGGRLTVESVPGAGTTVSFTLPMADAYAGGERDKELSGSIVPPD
jgi:signal transduction histidine kinase